MGRKQCSGDEAQAQDAPRAKMHAEKAPWEAHTERPTWPPGLNACTAQNSTSKRQIVTCILRTQRNICSRFQENYKPCVPPATHVPKNLTRGGKLQDSNSQQRTSAQHQHHAALQLLFLAVALAGMMLALLGGRL